MSRCATTRFIRRTNVRLDRDGFASRDEGSAGPASSPNASISGIVPDIDGFGGARANEPGPCMQFVSRLARREDRAVALEAEALRGDRGEVVLAVAHVGAAVDHRGGHGPAVVAEGDLGAAGERLVRHADLRVAEAAAAAGP